MSLDKLKKTVREGVIVCLIQYFEAQKHEFRINPENFHPGYFLLTKVCYIIWEIFKCILCSHCSVYYYSLFLYYGYSKSYVINITWWGSHFCVDKLHRKKMVHCREIIVLGGHWVCLFLFCLFDLILYIQSTIFQLNREGFSWVEPVLS